MTQETVETLARRLDALERQNRRLKHTMVAIGLLVVAATATAQIAPAKSAAVVGSRFTLVDQDNRTRAEIDNGVARLGPVMTFYDGGGRPRIRFGLGQRGPLLQVIDESGKTRDYFGPPIVHPATER